MRARPLASCLLALLLAAVAPGATAASRRRITDDGFVLAGQSNMLGASTQFENLTLGRVTSPAPNGISSWAFRARGDNAWTLANEFPCDDSQCNGTACVYPGPNRTVEQHPQWTDHGAGTCVCSCGVHIPSDRTDSDAHRGSAWPTFAALWMERQRRAYLVASAMGGECLVGSYSPTQPAWDPNAMDCSTMEPISYGDEAPTPQHPGEFYCRMVEAVATSRVPHLRAVLWYQGECDASMKVARSDYESALERLADAVWRDLGVPMIVAPISRKTRTDDACESSPAIDAIHAATVDAAAAHPHIFLGPNTDDLPLESDCVHIHDVMTLGQRWYQAVLDAGVAP